MVQFTEHYDNSRINNQIILATDDQLIHNQFGNETDDFQPFRSYRENIEPYVTSFVCLLAPRFEEHLIIGDLSNQLDIWMRDICISFGWQLKFIDIKPEYLHWIITVSITTYPTQFINVIRRETSKLIFDDFPRFKQRNLSNEFWAPWYFVGVGDVPYSKNTIQSFIQQIRIEQGL